MTIRGKARYVAHGNARNSRSARAAQLAICKQRSRRVEKCEQYPRAKRTKCLCGRDRAVVATSISSSGFDVVVASSSVTLAPPSPAIVMRLALHSEKVSDRGLQRRIWLSGEDRDRGSVCINHRTHAMSRSRRGALQLSKLLLARIIHETKGAESLMCYKHLVTQ
jgi:hypothetical protein